MARRTADTTFTEMLRTIFVPKSPNLTTRLVSTWQQSSKILTCKMQGYNSIYSTDSAEDSERERTKRNALGRLARKRFEAMLRALSGKRGEIARCMAFALEHAEAATEVNFGYKTKKSRHLTAA